MADGYIDSDLPTSEDPEYQAHLEQQAAMALAPRRRRERPVDIGNVENPYASEGDAC